MVLKLFLVVIEKSRVNIFVYCFIYLVFFEVLCYLFFLVEFKSKYFKEISIGYAW